MLSIQAKKEGNVYSVNPKSHKEVVPAFSVVVKTRFAGLDMEHNPIAPAGNARLCAEVMKKLCDHYPGYTWLVEIDDRTSVGMVNIYNANVNAELFSNAPYGYQLHLSHVQEDPSLKCVVRAGGEILERAMLVRGPNKGEEIKLVDGVKPHHQPLKIQ